MNWYSEMTDDQRLAVTAVALRMMLRSGSAYPNSGEPCVMVERVPRFWKDVDAGMKPWVAIAYLELRDAFAS